MRVRTGLVAGARPVVVRVQVQHIRACESLPLVHGEVLELVLEMSPEQVAALEQELRKVYAKMRTQAGKRVTS